MENCHVPTYKMFFLKMLCCVHLKLLSISVLKQRGTPESKPAMFCSPDPKGRQRFSVCLQCGVAKGKGGKFLALKVCRRSTSLSLEMNYLGRNHQGQFY